MLGLPNLPDMWRVLKEADLNKVRREAERPFQVLLVAENVRDAEQLGVLLSGPETARHPWLLTADPAEAQRAARSVTLDLAGNYPDYLRPHCRVTLADSARDRFVARTAGSERWKLRWNRHD
jgi:hypothetical protein